MNPPGTLLQAEEVLAGYNEDAFEPIVSGSVSASSRRPILIPPDSIIFVLGPTAVTPWGSTWNKCLTGAGILWLRIEPRNGLRPEIDLSF